MTSRVAKRGEHKEAFGDVVRDTKSNNDNRPAFLLLALTHSHSITQIFSMRSFSLTPKHPLLGIWKPPAAAGAGAGAGAGLAATASAGLGCA